ncbi:hypothetical protein [Adlercreutzia sp. ZJ242]|uniref:hypothetical protein n=1 Tax=Adlercreutzia sp. ZJ242 TaxID=2709409 RepID=UPI0013E9CA7D|nr:hypothetical protein [Adlercreutzia sp. ZJ242]
MNEAVCEKCGSSDFVAADGCRICVYCRTKYQIEKVAKPPETTISIGDDVQELLAKCKADPINARRYANLILDIDPSNAEAKAIVRR